MTTIADMSLEELRKLIDEIVEQHLALDTSEAEQMYETDTRSLQEVYASLDRNLWTPPPGTPSTTELLREDRDR